ncbi:MAG: MarC family protein [Pseudomonadota bacterium]|jgi:small neutral amino acid transporter SnatA (MarC family)
MDGSFLSATFLLFLVFDPFGNTPIVAALLRGVAPGRRWQVVLRECMIAYGVLLAGRWLIEALGERVMTAVERLMGLILSALAVEMLLRGIQAFVRAL